MAKAQIHCGSFIPASLNLTKPRADRHVFRALPKKVSA
jgi:hypothetical protein